MPDILVFLFFAAAMLQDCDPSGNASAPFLFFPTRARPCVAALLVEYAIARKVNIASSTSLSGFLESYRCVEDYMRCVDGCLRQT